MPSLTFSDWTGIIGILVSLLGFGVALAQIRKTKTAAESANTSAGLARNEIRRLDTLLEFASVSKSMEDIQNAFREERFDAIPLLLHGARKSLISAMKGRPTMSDEDRAKIDQTLEFLTDLEGNISKSKREQIVGKHLKITKALVQHSNAVTALLAEVKMGE